MVVDDRILPPEDPPADGDLRWMFLRQAHQLGRSAQDTLERVRYDVARLQMDLAAEIGRNFDGRVTLKELEKSMKTLQEWRTEMRGSWKVIVALAAFFASIAGSVVGGVVLYLITKGKP